MSGSVQGFKKWVVHRMAASHLAGPELEDAVKICHQASQRGWSCTFGYWNNPHDTPEQSALLYAAALKVIIEQSLDCYLSIKAPLINYNFTLLKNLLELAEEGGVRIHFDAMDPASASPTFELLERALKIHRNLGCTLPSRWRRSVHDASRIIDLGIPVRVVKGQWADPVAPGLNPRTNFLEIIWQLSGKAAHVAVATHDRALAKEALQLLQDAGSSCEMEQLSSLPQNCERLSKSLGIPLRVYIPYGYPSLPYDIWQLHTRPGIIGWVMRGFLSGKHRTLSTVL